ncbi:MAG: GHKL domain-containing protein [Psychromonas sp.]|nr:GHKL domain-containing protein [Alteromonadales bacterium]MCP5079201.1 GHKL domain-containing protein [Psychromonas sp.]
MNTQKQQISIQSQAIAHTVKTHFQFYSQQLSATAQRWHSINDINNSWKEETNLLLTHFPAFSNINLYLLEKQDKLTIDNRYQQHFSNDTEILQQAKELFTLNKRLTVAKKNKVFQSEHEVLDNNQIIIYQHAPIFINKELIGYLQSTLNITQLLDQLVATFQITSPFSLSETGRTIYTVLPTDVFINDIKQQFTIPLLNHEWKLMVWPTHQHYFYRYAAITGLILSILIAQLFYLARLNRYNRYKLTTQESHLTAINKDFKASKSKLIQSNKLSSLGEIATGIAHEINQPLQVICIHADMCQESLQKQNYRLVEKSFRSIISQVERIEKIVKQVGSFGRDSELDNYNQETPTSIFENVIDIVINQYNQEQIELRQVLPHSLPSIMCNKTQIEQVLVNLLINAKDAVEDSEEKIVFIKAHDKQGKLYIEVSDSGSGIEPSKLDDIFTPFYTTKALGRGTGLGLSISYSIIHQHKGEFQVSSEMGKGSTFTVILPLNN